MQNRIDNWCYTAMQVALLLLGISMARPCLAQDTVEYAGATSSTAIKSLRLAKPKKWTITPSKTVSPSTAKTSAYLVAPVGDSAAANRREFEENAGKLAASIMLRSQPTNARIWINGKFVGSTPTLLILPPGKYQVKASDDRSDSVTQEIALLPHETREVLLHLAVYYPTRVSIR